MAIPAPLTINPLVAARLDGDTKPWTGVLILEDIELLVSGVRNGSWIEGGLGAISYGLDARSFVIDPVGTLLSYGIAWLIEHGYQRMEAVEIPGEFSRRGGILDVFSPDAEAPYRIEFLGDEIASIIHRHDTQHSLDTIADSLIGAVEQKRMRNQDNTTVIVIRAT